MVKISEISNKQLLMQIIKYKKIMDQLLKERENRRARGAPGAELFTPQELSKMQAISSAPKSKPAKEREATADISSPDLTGESFQLEIDVDEINRLRAEEEKAKAAKGEDEEEVRVTQLLQLSKDQIAELKKAAKKK